MSEYGAIFCHNCGAGLLSSSPLVELHQQHQPYNAVPQVRPWVRFWARIFDITLWSTVLGFLVAIYLPTAVDGRVAELEFNFLVLISWILAESVLLSTLGTTPGKSLLKIELSLPGSKSISFPSALNRSFKVWWRGLGAGFVLVLFFTLLHAESVLTRDSMTSWDRDAGFIVRHKKIGLTRAVIAAGFLAVFYGAVLLSMFISEK